MTDKLSSPPPQLRITVTAEVPDDPGQHYTAVEMLLALTNGLEVRGVTPSLLRPRDHPTPPGTSRSPAPTRGSPNPRHRR